MPLINAGCMQVWPRSQPELSLGPHVDSQSEELLATTYLGPVSAEDGGFTIWPGSHSSMWCASNEEINWVQNAEYGARMQKVQSETQPLIFTGDIGDTLFVRAPYAGFSCLPGAGAAAGALSSAPACVSVFLCIVRGLSATLPGPQHPCCYANLCILICISPCSAVHLFHWLVVRCPPVCPLHSFARLLVRSPPLA